MKSLKIKIPLNTFFWLLYREIRVLWNSFFSQWIDFAILTASGVLIAGYVLPHLGVPADYGIFMMVGQIVCWCLWGPAGDSGQLVTDLDGVKAISSDLVLPTRYWLVYCKIALAYAIKAAALNLLSIPLGILLVINSFDFSVVSVPKFLLIYPIVNIFYAFFILFIAVHSKNITSYNRFWMRWGAQLFLFSGFQFSWMVLNKASKFWSYFNLLNPLVYTYEGMRIPFMGQAGFLNFWACVFALIFSTIVFAFFGLRRFKKRLDCV